LPQGTETIRSLRHENIKETPESMKKRLLTILVIAAMISGLSLMLYPVVSDYINRVRRAGDISAYAESVAGIQDDDYTAIWESAKAYNDHLSTLPAHWELNEQERTEYEAQVDVTGKGIMAYIEIPKLNCSLPIYHGTGDEVLQIAIGHLAGSSLPTGGLSTHCVISGHRGLPSAKLFTDLDKLAEGDVFTLRTLDQTLSYEVDQISIVEPTDTALLQIVQGEDLCTLMTCTPYGVNSHRLLVRGRRVENARSAEIRVTADALQLDPLIVASVLAVILILCILIVSVIVLIIKRR
jgi:sortase A